MRMNEEALKEKKVELYGYVDKMIKEIVFPVLETWDIDESHRVYIRKMIDQLYELMSISSDNQTADYDRLNCLYDCFDSLVLQVDDKADPASDDYFVSFRIKVGFPDVLRIDREEIYFFKHPGISHEEVKKHYEVVLFESGIDVGKSYKRLIMEVSKERPGDAAGDLETAFQYENGIPVHKEYWVAELTDFRRLECE